MTEPLVEALLPVKVTATLEIRDKDGLLVETQPVELDGQITAEQARQFGLTPTEESP